MIEGWGRLLAEVSPRFSPLRLLLRTAAEADHEAGLLYEELDRDRLARMAENAPSSPTVATSARRHRRGGA